MPFHILALDPGKTNFGWAVASTQPLKDCKMVSIAGKALHTLTGKFVSLISIEDQRVRSMDQYISELHGLLSYLPSNDLSSYIVFERMIPQPGRGRGAVAEIVNIMIGVTVREADRRGIQMFPVTASQWKRWAKVTKYLDLSVDPQEEISVMAKTWRDPHSQDALGMALWSYSVDPHF